MYVPPIYPALFEASREKVNADLMKEEWIAMHREEAEEPMTCPCGKVGIKELCWIKNILTGIEMFIGNECILHISEEGIGLCADCKLYPCVSHSALYCKRCGRGTRDKPTGLITRGKWKGTRYNDPALKNYEKWAVEPENRKFIDPHYLVWIQRQQDIKIKTVSLEMRRRRLALKTEVI